MFPTRFSCSVSRALLFLACALLLPLSATAEWPSDPLVNVPLCTAANYQLEPAAVSDGAGGAIVTWRDARNAGSYSDIYAQRVLASGAVDPAWPANGRALCTGASTVGWPMIVSDGAGGAIVTWEDLRNGADNRDIYAQHVLASGAVDPAWPLDGRALATAASGQANPAIVSDGAGGAVVTWEDTRNAGSLTDIYAQRVLAGGAVDPAWPTDGRALCTADNHQVGPEIVSDGVGGAIVTWEDRRYYSRIYAQHVLVGGAVDPAWPMDGRALSTSTASESNPAIVSDGAGGAVVTWWDTRNAGSSWDIYAHHVLADSGLVDPAWPANGRALCTAAGTQAAPALVSDGAGGAIVTWEDHRSGNANIYAQHVLASGAVDPGWPADGSALSTAYGDQRYPRIVSDLAGGAIVTWEDNRSGVLEFDIYAQRVGPDGVLGGDGSGCGPNNPAILTQPSSQTVAVGGTASFSVGATGSPPLGYQWRKNGGDIAGATASTYTISPVGLGDAGSYNVRVTGPCGADTSDTAVLTVPCTAPAVTTQPQNQTVAVGGTASFSVGATGSPPLGYQWRKNGGDIGGATASTYTISPVGLGDAASYNVRVTGPCGTVTSNTAVLTVPCAAPAVTTQPQSQTVAVGGTANFSVGAIGTPPLGYQWRKTGAAIPGATSAAYSINPVALADSGNYDVVVENACGGDTSDVAVLHVLDCAPPVATISPPSHAVIEGCRASFGVTASGTSPLSYQWRRNGAAIPGATSAAYTIGPVALADSGGYDVVVENRCGSDTSDLSMLYVRALPALRFASPVAYPVYNTPTAVAIADLNGDGRPDIAVCHRFSANVALFFGNGDGTFQQPSMSVAAVAGGKGIATGDFNADGDPDLALASESYGAVVLLNNGNGTFGVPSTYASGGAAVGLVVARFNADALQDLAVVNHDDGTVGILLGGGDGTFAPATPYSIGGSNPYRIATGDLDGDGHADLVAGNSTAGVFSLVRGAGDGSFGAWQAFSALATPYGIRVADLDRDGKQDVVVANANSQQVSVFRGNGDGTFSQRVDYPTAATPFEVRVEDLDGDGMLDVATVASGAGVVSVLLGQGDGSLGPKVDFPCGVSPEALAVADLNGDGRPDIVVQNYNPPNFTVSVLMNATVPVSVQPAPPLVGSLRAVPNPFRGRMEARIDVPAAVAHLRVEVLDVRGRRVATLFDDRPAAGFVKVVWDGHGVSGTAASGVYLIRALAPGFLSQQLVVFVR